MARRLPSLAGLSLQTTTGLDVRDRMINALAPNTRLLDILFLQNRGLDHSFGVDKTLHDKLKAVVKAFDTRRRTLFITMMHALRNKRVLVVDGSQHFFFTANGDDSASELIKKFRVGDLTAVDGIQLLGRGTSNSTYKVNLEVVLSDLPGFLTLLKELTADDSMALRRSRSMSGDQAVTDVLLELAVQSLMSQLEIGPRMYFAWCEPTNEFPDLDASQVLDEKASRIIKRVFSLMESFDGDLSGVFKPSPLSKDALVEYENGRHEFWLAVGRCVVKACRYGCFHMDLKPGNMLYRRSFPKTGPYKYIVRYTDFDPYFFKVLNMKLPNIKEMEVCFGVVQMSMIVSCVRCWSGTKTFYDGDGEEITNDWDDVWDMAMEGFKEAYKETYKEFPTMPEIEKMCDLDSSFRPPRDDDLRTTLASVLQQWFRGYLSNPGCADIDPSRSFDRVAQVIVDFARGQ